MEWRVLVVEDMENTRQQLVQLLKETVGDVDVDQAGSVCDALDLITQAHASGKDYHVAILDFKLPKTARDNPEVDVSVCSRVRDLMPNAFIVHFTGYAGDREVDVHMSTVHGQARPDQARCWLIDKGSADWPGELLAQIKGFLEGTRKTLARARVREGLDELFGASETGSARGAYKGAGFERCVTHELESLCHDISRLWDDLDDDLKKRVNEHLTVLCDGRNVRVGLK